MGKFNKLMDIEHLIESKQYLVPIIFTERQFDILIKSLKNQKLSINERVDLYRAVNKKISAMLKMLDLETDNLFVYGKEYIIKDRFDNAKKILKKIQRNHKGQKILISGSYLWKKNFNDIDIFILTKYDKEDYKEKNIHINYIPFDAEGGLFFQSLAKISISDFKISQEVKEKPTLDTAIMLYQKIITHITQKEDIKNELRSFVLEAKYLESGTVLSSKEIDKIISSIMKHKNIIQRINLLLVETLIIAYKDKFLEKKLLPLIENNERLMEEYKNIENLTIINKTLTKVIEIES
ncbi:hypothetical protein ACFL0W_03510 [Nanoarchaeota archaeon]